MTLSKKAYHHGDLRMALLKAAAHLIETDGIDAVTMRALSQQVGVSRTAAYRHFANKTDLLGAVAAAATSEDDEVSIPIGIVTTMVAGAMIPIVSVGAASARKNPAVIGHPGFRLAGWIGYGFAMTDAIILIGLSFAAFIPPSVTVSVGVLGAASAIFMALDAKASHDQAVELKARMGRADLRPRLRPIVSVTPDPFRPGAVRAFAGVGGVF